MDQLQFQYPQAFWLFGLLPLFLLLYFFYYLWKKKARKRLGDERLVKELLASHSPSKSILKYFLIIIAFALGIITLANPRVPEEGESEARSGIDVVLALDISNSMLANDVPPNRLGKAKFFMSKLIEKMKDNRISLLLFAGNAYIQTPLTYDQSAVQMMLSAATPDMIAAQGTNINEALDKAEIAFAVSEDRYKLVVMLSDGEGHDESAVNKVAKLSSDGMVVYTVGIGSPEGGQIIDPKTNTPRKDMLGNVINTKLNEQYLKDLAAAANGNYYHLDNVEGTVNAVFNAMDTAEKKSALGNSSIRYQTLYAPFAVTMLFLLLAELFISDRKRRSN